MTSTPNFLLVTDLDGTERFATLDLNGPRAQLISNHEVLARLEDLTARLDAHGRTLSLVHPTLFAAVVAEDGEVVAAPCNVANRVFTGADATLLRRTLALTDPWPRTPDEQQPFTDADLLGRAVDERTDPSHRD